ncbi:MAG: hypothetical protein AAF628_34100 [Planctomycetota bacterium]
MLALAAVASLVAVVVSHRQATHSDAEAVAHRADSAPTSAARDAAIPAATPAVGWIENRGQWDHPARFVLRGALSMFLEPRGWTVDLVERTTELRAATPDAPTPRAHLGDLRTEARATALRMTFTGTRGAAQLDGMHPLACRHNYFLGSDPERWTTDVPVFAQVRYADLYRGVDVQVRLQDGTPEYDLLLQPGADLATVAVRVDGADGLRLEADGALYMDTSLGPVRQPAPTTWQEDPAGARESVTCRYVLLDEQHFGFAVDGWDPALPLTIDPGLQWSTMVRGATSTGVPRTQLRAVHLADDGFVTVCGGTFDTQYPTTAGAYQTAHLGSSDLCLSWFDPTQTGAAQLMQSTFIGGSGSEIAAAFEVDATGVVTLCGQTNSGNFPTSTGAYQSTAGGRADAFVVQIDPSQTGAAQLTYGTLLGGADADFATRCTFDGPSGLLTLIGDTSSTGFPTTTNAFDRSFNGGSVAFPFDSFVVRLDLTQTGAAQLVYSTFFGGTSWETSTALVVSSKDWIGIGGETVSTDLPVTSTAYDQTQNGMADAFITWFNPNFVPALQLRYSTFLGGSGADAGVAMVQDANEVVTLTGNTFSADFPVTAGAFDPDYTGTVTDVFVTQIDPRLPGDAQLVFSTYLGEDGSDNVFGIIRDDVGHITVVGDTSSTTFPTSVGTHDDTYNGGPSDVYVTRLDPLKTGAAQLVYSTYLGGGVGGEFGTDLGYAVDGNNKGAVAISGETNADNFPVTPGAFANPGTVNTDGFLATLDMLPTGVSVYGEGSRGCRGVPWVSALSTPNLGNSSFMLTCGNAPRLGAGLLIASTGPAAAPIPIEGIDLWIDLLSGSTVFLPVFSDPRGLSEQFVPIDGDGTLIGLSFYAQFVWVATGLETCPPLGLSASNGVQVTILP